MNDYKYSLEKLYEHTDNGLEILHRYCPECVGAERTRRNFKIRNERTPSASLFKGKECWYIKDFGSGEAFSPMAIFQKETGISDFYEALKMLCSEFNVTENSHYFQPNKTYKDKGDLPDDYFFIKVKDKVENPQCFSAFVTAELCQKYNVFEVEYFERIIENRKLLRVTATENYPIFCYSSDIKKWAKTYCPAEKKRTITNEDGTRKTQSYKHGYLGKKPEKYYHGLTAVEERYNELQKLDNGESEEKPKIPYIIICSGGADGLSVASLSKDFMPVWGNSENDIIDYKTYEFLKSICENLVYLPDMDTSGVNFAYKYSHAYWKLPVVFLPKYYLGEKGKDFRDYLAHFTKKANPTPKEIIASEFKKLLAVPVCFDFVVFEDKRYRISQRNLDYFLSGHNLVVCRDNLVTNDYNNDIKGFLVELDGYKVRVVDETYVRNFCVDFYTRKGTTQRVLELIKSCNALRGSDLKKAPSKELDFSKHGRDYQLFFFENMCVKVSAEKVENIANKDIQNYVFENNIKNHHIRLSDEKFFEYYQDEKGRNRVKILKNDFDFMNFLINTSRVFWKKEADQNPDYRKITLNSSYLTEEEQIIQEQHFLGKCYAIGYLLHKYNISDYAKFVYIVDDEEKDGFLEANGGTGKSLFMTAVGKMATFFDLPAKEDKLLEDKHLFARLKEKDDIVCFDDMTSKNDFTKLYSFITRGVFINPKGVDGYFLPFEKSPKFAGTFNYALKNAEQSTLRRILFVSFSSYYHTENQDYKEWQPRNDFNGRFFDDWNIGTWNMFYNFMFCCLQLFLQNRYNELKSPTDNVTKNNLKASIGDSFLEWIEDYLQEEQFETYLTKDEMFLAFKSDMPRSTLTKPSFKKKIVNYCKLKGYEFNPVDVEGYQENGKRITRFIYGKTQECFYFRKTENNKNTETKTANTEIQPQKPQNDDWLDDIAF